MELGFATEVERRTRSAHELATRLATASPDARDELLSELQRDAHTLRGSALVLGLDDVASFAADLEERARSGELDLGALGERVEQVIAGLPKREPARLAGRIRPAAGAKRILCVDDSEPNLLLLERYLARRVGIAFIPARTGAEALQLAATERPDLVLLDLQLPDIPGLAVLERLVADAGTAAVPIVIVSADARQAQLAAAQELGARDYLVKPLDLTRLGAVLDAILLPEERG